MSIKCGTLRISCKSNFQFKQSQYLNLTKGFEKTRTKIAEEVFLLNQNSKSNHKSKLFEIIFLNHTSSNKKSGKHEQY